MKKSTVSLLIFVFIFGCTNSDNKKNTAKITHYDDLKRKVLISNQVNKVVCLAPSITEICSQICKEKLISKTQACNFPESILNLPILETMPLDIEKIIELKPDVVFSVDGMIQTSVLEKLSSHGIAVYIQKYNSIDDILRNIKAIGEITNKKTNSDSLLNALKIQLNELNKTKSTQTSLELKVLVVTWFKPIYVYGFETLFTEKIKLAGAKNMVTSEIKQPYPEINSEYILSQNPDIILGGTFEHLDTVFFSIYPELKKTNAYVNRHVYDVNDDLMSRPSHRFIESITELKQIIHKVEN